MFNKETEYVISIIYLLKKRNNRRLTCKKLATVGELKLSFVRLVVFKLRKLGWVEVKTGIQGGVKLTKEGYCLTFWDILYNFNPQTKKTLSSLSPYSKEVFYNCEEKLKKVYIKPDVIES